MTSTACARDIARTLKATEISCTSSNVYICLTKMKKNNWDFNSCATYLESLCADSGRNVVCSVADSSKHELVQNLNEPLLID